jgi:hypothetical protein
VFYQCLLSGSDARYPKYPRLPVLRCSGYEEKPPPQGKPNRPMKDQPP